MLLQLSHFSPFIPLHPVPPSHPHSPPLSSCPWVVHITSLASTFPILFLTSPCLFSTYQLCFLFPVPFPYSFPFPPPLITLHEICISVNLFLFSYLLSLFCFSRSVVDSFEFVVILLFILLIFFFLDSPFNISYKGLVMMNSFNLTLPEKHFICPSILNDSFAGYSNLGCRSLPFMTLNTSCQSLLACKVSFEKSADSLMGTPL